MWRHYLFSWICEHKHYILHECFCPPPPQEEEDDKMGIEQDGDNTKVQMDQYYPDEYDQYDEGKNPEPDLETYCGFFLLFLWF